MSEGSMAGRVALVTGAAGGIGAAVTRRLQEDGARVAALDLHRAPAADASAVADLRSAPAIDAAVAELEAALGPAEVLIHCAAICPPGTLMDSADEVFADTYAVNVIAAARLMRHCAVRMRERGGGSIVLLTSINARFATPTLAAYASSKAALEELARTAALELAPWQIRVNAIAPASIDTAMLQSSFDREPDPAQARERNIQRHPLGRLGTPQDIAELAWFLASDRSGWITGGVFPVDGGAGVTRR
ncbi:SDR family NAD(P)-dependent oxidoreductase [Lysobacter sp. GCM10012299]|uniref:SDR family NAD(P)-dependent oxidoreductase n=1 Tax=Lysobacter sp. GCM10012299 TaxID=3317333 RepID=UPI003624587D